MTHDSENRKVFRFTDEDLKMLHSLLVDKTNDWEKELHTNSYDVYRFLHAIKTDPDTVENRYDGNHDNEYYYTKQ